MKMRAVFRCLALLLFAEAAYVLYVLFALFLPWMDLSARWDGDALSMTQAVAVSLVPGSVAAILGATGLAVWRGVSSPRLGDGAVTLIFIASILNLVTLIGGLIDLASEPNVAALLLCLVAFVLVIACSLVLTHRQVGGHRFEST